MLDYLLFWWKQTKGFREVLVLWIFPPVSLGMNTYLPTQRHACVDTCTHSGVTYYMDVML